MLRVHTQGHTRKDAWSMVEDAIESLVNKPGFRATVYPADGGNFEVGASDEAALIAFMLRQERARSGLTLAQVAKKLGAKSINSYARYEQGRAVPTISKLSQLYAAVAKSGDFVISESRG